MRKAHPRIGIERNDASLWLSFLLVAALACTRKEAPQLQPAAAPPPPPAPVVRDAASDVGDAATDASDARAPAKKSVGAPANPGGGGTGALKVEGSLSRADGDKVLRPAQAKLRACFEEANPPGA